MRVRLMNHQHHVTGEGDVLVCDTHRAVVHTVRGEHAATLRAAIDAAALSPDDLALDVPDDHVTRDLLATGLLVQLLPDDDRDGHTVEMRHVAPAAPAAHHDVDRRRFLGLGAGLTAGIGGIAGIAGITTMALPTAAHAASAPVGDPPVIATTTTTALPPAPTGDQYIGVNAGARKFVVYWEPVPGPFTYVWRAYDTSNGKTLLASGTASASFDEVVVYTWPESSSNVRLEVSSNTNPSLSDAVNHPG